MHNEFSQTLSLGIERLFKRSRQEHCHWLWLGPLLHCDDKRHCIQSRSVVNIYYASLVMRLTKITETSS